MTNDKIDFVIIWVDGNDKEWQKQRNLYAGKDPEDIADYRYRDFELLKYWFRGVEKFAPWVNNVFFVTCGQVPEWLNLKNPKLKFVKHEDYIPKEYLPTFNSDAIELNLHRISSLSEKFVYFNDDMFLIDKVKKDDFFDEDIPKYVAGLDLNDSNNGIFSKILLNNMQLILKDNAKDKNSIIKANIFKWFNIKYSFKTNLKTLLLLPFNFFSVLRNTHCPSPLIKKDFEKIWMKNEEILNNTSSHKFRDKEDVNQYILSWNRTIEGNFKPAKEKIGKYFEIGKGSKNIIKDVIKKQKCKMICINDSTDDINFETTKNELKEAFEKILPDKSSFEV